MTDNFFDELLKRLPPIESFRVRCEADFYGASYLIANALNIHSPPRSFSSWIHGLYPGPFKKAGDIIQSFDKNAIHLVGTKSQQQFLQALGFTKTVAVGAPFGYVRDSENLSRFDRSLLVMPGHTSKYFSPNWNHAEYIDFIISQRSQFSFVAACLSPFCVSQGFWLPELKKANIPFVIGANSNDKHALLRMWRLLSSFEFMTSNTFGSHIVYAAYRGAKVSISGPFGDVTKESVVLDPRYKADSVLQSGQLAANSRASLIQNFPWLFTEILLASDKREWAAMQLGLDCQIPEREMSILLGWEIHRQVKGYARWLKNLPQRVFQYGRTGHFPMDL